ncbi:FkbM family methyltransferase [Winogradskyella forsetii]|uniref:FkbM family methyltransferase n=1 Tax=Winogradskyella forsetii TaxID=2686077 RepID=UPI0015C19D4E|nr:FkbM family methyltransferase [Winogradskyella forsetii]
MSIKNIGIGIYNSIPSNIKNVLGKQNWLKPLRDSLFRKNGSYKEVETIIKRTYQNYPVEFKFMASFQVSVKASKRGIESKLLNNSMKLLNKYRPNNNDLHVLDVGANFGFLSLVWANTIASKGQIRAFEPSINLVSTINKSIKLNNLQDRLVVEHNAVGKEIKEVELFISNTTSNVLDINESGEVQKVKMISLDHYMVQSDLKQYDLLKIDVDGIELDILEGAVKLIKQFKPIVIVETNDNRDIVAYMKTLQYTILDMDLNEFKEPNPLPSNVFCVPNEAYL